MNNPLTCIVIKSQHVHACSRLGAKVHILFTKILTKISTKISTKMPKRSHRCLSSGDLHEHAITG
jgi:hypothetical protein